MRHEKLTELSVSYFFRTDDYTVVIETSGMKYGTKNIQRRATDGTTDLSLKIAIG